MATDLLVTTLYHIQQFSVSHLTPRGLFICCFLNDSSSTLHPHRQCRPSWLLHTHGHLLTPDPLELSTHSNSQEADLSLIYCHLVPSSTGQEPQKNSSASLERTLPSTAKQSSKEYWEGNRQESQGSPNRGNRLQVSDIFLSLLSCRRKQTSGIYFFPFSIQI